MAQRIVPGPSLTAVASPVDRFVAPVRQEVSEDPMLSLARTLERINPSIQDILQNRYAEYAATEEARGQIAESKTDPSVALDNNREGWRTLIEQARAADRANGTNNADRLAAASPHFRRGVVKARAQRLGMALNDYLLSAYSRNPSVEIDGRTVNLMDTDDQRAVQLWMQQESQAYAERMGIGQIDPLLVAEVYQPIAQRAQESVMSYHTQLRLDRFTQESIEELSAMTGMILSGGVPVGEGYDEAGVSVVAKTAMNNLEGALGTKLNVISAYRDPAQNKRVRGAKRSQHLKGNAFDVDVSGMSIEQRKALIRSARQAGFSGIGVYKNSLHFDVGGDRYWGPSYGHESLPAWAKEAVTEPVGNITRINPIDEIAARLQVTVDQFTSDGMDKQKANETVVDSVLAAAFEQKNADILEVLNRIQAGSGILGNIAWVREKKTRAEEQIEEIRYKEEVREQQRLERQRNIDALAINIDATRRIFSDPGADVSDLVESALDSENPETAKGILSLQDTALNRLYTVRTNPEAYADMRLRIYNSRSPEELSRLATEITSNTGTLFSIADTNTLMDDLDQVRRYGNIFEMNEVRKQRSFLEDTIESRFGVNIFGEMQGGEEKKISASNWFYSTLGDFVRKNPEATEREISIAAQNIVRDMLNSPQWQNTDATDKPERVTVGNTQETYVPGDASGVVENVIQTNIEPDASTKEFLKTEKGYGLLKQLADINGMDVETYARLIGLLDNEQ